MKDLKGWLGKQSRDMSVKKNEIAILAPQGILTEVTLTPGISSPSQKQEVITLFHGTNAKYTFNASLVMVREKDGTETIECILLEIMEKPSLKNLNDVDGELIKSVIGKL